MQYRLILLGRNVVKVMGSIKPCKGHSYRSVHGRLVRRLLFNSVLFTNQSQAPPPFFMACSPRPPTTSPAALMERALHAQISLHRRDRHTAHPRRPQCRTTKQHVHKTNFDFLSRWTHVYKFACFPSKQITTCGCTAEHKYSTCMICCTHHGFESACDSFRTPKHKQFLVPSIFLPPTHTAPTLGFCRFSFISD
jgi:hypothetical protein